MMQVYRILPKAFPKSRKIESWLKPEAIKASAYEFIRGASVDAAGYAPSH